MKRWLDPAAVAMFSLLLAMPSMAQGTGKKPFQGYIAGGYVLSEGDTGEFTDDGWEISGGVIYRFSPQRPFALRLDVGYNWFDANDQAIRFANLQGLQVDDGDMSLGTLTVEAMYEFGGSGTGSGVGGYVALGFGGMRRYGELTTTVPVSGIWCDPWTGFCYPGYTAGEGVVANEALTKLEYSAAAGVTFGVGGGEMYVEARYHWMDADRPSTQMLPILVGYRF